MQGRVVVTKDHFVSSARGSIVATSRVLMSAGSLSSGRDHAKRKWLAGCGDIELARCRARTIALVDEYDGPLAVDCDDGSAF